MTASESKGRWSDRRLTVVLFALALVVYMPATWWGLPDGSAPDRVPAWGGDELAPLGPLAEPYSVFLAPEPKTFNPQYPLLQYLIQAVFTAPYLAWLYVTGGISSPSPVYPFGLADPVPALRTMTLLARIPTLLMGAVTVALTFLVARTWWNRETGVIAAVFVLLMYPMFYYARTSNVDVPALCWTVAGMLAFVLVLKRGLAMREALALGASAALSTATKDPGYAIFIPIGVMVLVTHLRRRAGQWPWSRSLREPAVALGVSVLVYVVASGLIFNLQRFLLHVDFIIHGSPGSVFYYPGPPSLSLYAATVAQTGELVARSLGWPVTVAAVVGIGLAAARRSRDLLLVFPALGLLFGVILPVRFVLLRFVIFMAWTAALFAAAALAAGLRSPAPLRRRLALLSVVVASGWSGLRGVDLTRQMLNDSRVALGRWLCDNVAAGETVGYYGAARKLPRLACGIETISMPDQAVQGRWVASGPQRPEFVLVIPQQPFEPVHEWTLADAAFDSLMDGTRGYQQVYAAQSPTWFPSRPVTFVNPPVRVFARNDVAGRVEAQQQIQLPDPGRKGS